MMQTTTGTVRRTNPLITAARLGLALAVIWTIGPVLARAGDDPPAEPFIRATEPDAPGVSIVRLQIASRRFVPLSGDGPAITLVGAVHVADAPFYEHLQANLDAHDAVLFEGVKPPGSGDPLRAPPEARIDPATATARRIRFLGTMVQRRKSTSGRYPPSLAQLADALDHRRGELVRANLRDAWGRPFTYAYLSASGNDADQPPGQAFDITSLGADGRPDGEGADADVRLSEQEPIEEMETAPGDQPGIQAVMARSLGLVFQLDGIDTDRPNWINSDLALDQIMDLMATGPDAGDRDGSDGSAIFEMLDGSSVSASLMRWIFSMVGSNASLQTMLKVLLIDMLSNTDLLEAGMPEQLDHLMRVLIQDRNAVVFEDLAALRRERPDVRSVAILYGVGHLEAMQRRLVGEMGYRPDSTAWSTAIEVDLSDLPIGPAMIQRIRSLFAKQMEQQIKVMRRLRERGDESTGATGDESAHTPDD